jgi:hypothetical protein
MLAAFFVQLYKLDGITGTSIAVAAKAAVGVGFGVNLEAWRFVRMEGAAEPVVPVGLQPVMLEYFQNGKLRLDVFDIHVEKI